MPANERAQHIVVINDTPQILDLFVELLGEEGYRVTPDRFSLELDQQLATVKAEAPDLVILDLIIQEEGLGWQFLQLLKMDRATRSIPVVVCTAAVKQVQELQAHLDEMGVAVVLKPFDIDHLLDVVAHALNQPADPHAAPETPDAPETKR